MTLTDTAVPRTVTPRGPVRIYPGGRVVAHPPRKGSRPVWLRPEAAAKRGGGHGGGNGVAAGRGPHRRRAITPATTAMLAMLAALITVWLGLIAQFGAAAADESAPVTERLGVVRVEPGENLQHLAARVAPDSASGRVADRIRELNGLDSARVDAGQTLISPLG